jgi:glucose-1-phosphate adenylyltransferase
MKELLCLVLGGGRGTRLYPLTKDRCKPAAPFAGKYRLVDVPISNCLNSGFSRIYVLTQFNSESLNKHIARTYKLDAFSGGFVDIMAAEQSMESADWFQGSADAVRRCLKHIRNPRIQYVLVLSGDQLYKMDLRRLLAFHRERDSQITIACNPVVASEIREFGIMCVDKHNRIKSFVEKPEDEHQVKGMHIQASGDNLYLASMGIYLFNKDVLREVLSDSRKTDFGKEVIPDSIPHKLTYAYIHEGYWKDIGTIKSFYEENIVFTDSIPPLDLFDEHWQFFTRPRYLPPAKIEDSRIDKAVIGDGSILRKCEIKHSVIGLRSRISEGAKIQDSIIMGGDFYQSLDDIARKRKEKQPYIGIGRNAVIKKAIIDKNACIGDGVKIINQKNLESFDAETYCIRDGIVIITKNSVIAPGTVI